jgi:hypothetical protein
VTRWAIPPLASGPSSPTLPQPLPKDPLGEALIAMAAAWPSPSRGGGCFLFGDVDMVFQRQFSDKVLRSMAASMSWHRQRFCNLPLVETPLLLRLGAPSPLSLSGHMRTYRSRLRWRASTVFLVAPIGGNCGDVGARLDGGTLDPTI